MKRESLNMCIQNTREQPIKKLKGFTLIELIVTVLIIGIVFAVGVPGLQSLLGNVSLNANADKLVNSLSYARGEAVARSANVSVAAIGGGLIGWNVFIDTNANCTRDVAVAAVAAAAGPPVVVASPAISEEEILKVVDITADNIQITGVNCVGFNALGENSAGAVVSLTIDSTEASSPPAVISISPIGYTSID